MGFMVEPTEEVSSNMLLPPSPNICRSLVHFLLKNDKHLGMEGVPESRSCVKFSPVMQFFVALIPPSLASARPADTATPEREQAAPTVTARSQEGECWIIV
jgi:hypothetical protein